MNILETLVQLRDDIKTWVTNNIQELNVKIDENTIPVDSELSATSTNPVQNQAITNAINSIPTFSGDYNDLANKPEIPSVEGLATETYVQEQVAGVVDETLTIEGAAADAKVVGEKLNDYLLKEDLNVFIDDVEPADAPEGSLWVDTDEPGGNTHSGQLILNDSITGTNYMLYVENGKLMMQETINVENNDVHVFKDTTTGKNYKLYVTNGELHMKEVE